MGNVLIIPGVQVSVVKEVLPQQLSPSGVLGLVGFTESAPAGVQRATSWNRVKELCGVGTAHGLPEARQALDNGASELVISPLPDSAGARASVQVPAAPSFRFTAKTAGAAANGAKIVVEPASGGKAGAFNLKVQRPGSQQFDTYEDLVLAADSNKHPLRALADSTLVTVEAASLRPADGEYLLAGGAAAAGETPAKAASVTLASGPGLTLTARTPGPWANGLKVWVTHRVSNGELAGYELAVQRPGTSPAARDAEVLRNLDLGERRVADALKQVSTIVTATGTAGWPAAGEYTLAGGQDASAAEYIAALDLLKDEPDVDMVLAAVQDFSAANQKNVAQVYSSVISHCDALSGEAKGRIGFGQVPRTGTPAQHADFAGALVSDRFVLVAPHGLVGAVAGLVGSLPYWHSPTFKRVSGVSEPSVALGVEAQSALLKANIVPVVLERGKGLVVVRGLTRDGDQISVRRVADRAVRTMKLIGDLFIGRLNDADGRGALKQKLTEALLQMTKDGALVPSTDGKDPAFKVDVYSSQADFALGIVRVDMAVRPVRAIDYIYATILVQV